MRTPLHTRICGTMAAGLIAGVLAWGGSSPERGVPSPERGVPSPERGVPSPERGVPAAGTTDARQASGKSVAVPLQATLHPPAPARDRDRIGPCPKRHSPVVWQGLVDGRPTWKHQDGSITQRARQKIRTREGEVLEVPVIVCMHPARAAHTR